MLLATTFILTSVLAAFATEFTVKVGANDQLIFDPTTIMAKDNDTIIFQFVSKNHSATQSTFTDPCTKLPTGWDSGFQNVSDPANPPTMNFTVANASQPMWFYCAQTVPIPHCQQGMVFAVNPPPDKTFDAFQAAAKASNGTSAGASNGGNGNGGSGNGGNNNGSNNTGGNDNGGNNNGGNNSGDAKNNGAVVDHHAGTLGVISFAAAVAAFML